MLQKLPTLLILMVMVLVGAMYWVDLSYYTDPATGETLRIRQDLIDYAETSLSDRTDKWSLNEEELQRLLKLAGQCAEKGVQLAIVLPPFDDSVYQLVIRPGGIQPVMEEALAALKASPAILLD